MDTTELTEAAQAYGTIGVLIDLLVVCAIMLMIGYTVYRWTILSRNIKYVAHRLDLIANSEGLGTVSIWGTLNDGRSINIYAVAGDAKARMLSWIAKMLLIPWSSARIYRADIGVHGAAAPDIPREEELLFNEYVYRALPAAVEKQRYALSPVGILNVTFQQGLIRASGIQFMGDANHAADAILALADIAREVEEKAVDELARRHKLNPAQSPFSTSRSSAATDDSPRQEITPESLICPYCQARTPGERPRCQMCGRPIEAAATAAN